MRVGDLVKYMSRTILVVELPGGAVGTWAMGLELGETQVCKYRRSVLEPIVFRCPPDLAGILH